MGILRSPTGCPWDREQTHKSIASNAIEEASELAEAIETNDEENLIEELGDVLLQVVFHSQIAKEEKRFDINKVIEKLNTKLVSRHPHVFADKDVKTASEALKSWSDVKAEEKKRLSKKQDGFGIPSHLPALHRAEKIGNKAKKMRFDWEDANQVFTHVESEILEFKEAMQGTDKDHLQEEFGDILFTLVQVGRKLGIDAEQALRITNQKVERRWIGMQEIARKNNANFEELAQSDLENLWKQVKLKEKKK